MAEPAATDASVAGKSAEPTLCPGDSGFLELVLEESGENILACYQCHKCASGCPVADKTDYTNDKLIRLIQLGDEETALKAKHLFTCLSCYTCSIRCPNDINGARLVEALKQIAHKKGIPPAKPDVKEFHNIFLNSVRRFGRVNEAELIGVFSMKTGFDWGIMLKSPAMFFKGRLHLWGGKVKGLKVVRKLMDKVLKDK